MEGLLTLTRKSTPSNFLYITERSGDSYIDKVWLITIELYLVAFTYFLMIS